MLIVNARWQGQTAVDEQVNGIGQGEQRSGRDCQKEQRKRNLPAVRRKVRQQCAQRSQFAARRAGIGSRRSGLWLLVDQGNNPRQRPQALPRASAPKLSMASRKPGPRVRGSRA